MIKAFLITFSLLVWLTPARADSAWGRIDTPLLGSPRVIGSYSGGCIAGAASLPLIGEGYQVMRPSRNRYYGHPLLIDLIERLGREAAARGQRLLIGDLGQPRGGPMRFAHRSHQIGLDVDIWFLQMPQERTFNSRETEQVSAVSMVASDLSGVNPARWSSSQRHILRLAAEAPEVERIFVNPLVKQALCRQELGDRDWLRKVRPWWGHDHHFHVRLKCPPNQPDCRPQQPVEPGDGCGEELTWWVNEIRSPPSAQKKTPPKPLVLPAACETVLNGR